MQNRFQSLSKPVETGGQNNHFGQIFVISAINANARWGSEKNDPASTPSTSTITSTLPEKKKLFPPDIVRAVLMFSRSVRVSCCAPRAVRLLPCARISARKPNRVFP